MIWSRPTTLGPSLFLPASRLATTFFAMRPLLFTRLKHQAVLSSIRKSIPMSFSKTRKANKGISQCMNLKVTGGGSDAPAGVLGTELYKAADPGVSNIIVCFAKQLGLTRTNHSLLSTSTSSSRQQLIIQSPALHFTAAPQPLQVLQRQNPKSLHPNPQPLTVEFSAGTFATSRLEVACHQQSSGGHDTRIFVDCNNYCVKITQPRVQKTIGSLLVVCFRRNEKWIKLIYRIPSSYLRCRPIKSMSTHLNLMLVIINNMCVLQVRRWTAYLGAYS